MTKSQLESYEYPRYNKVHGDVFELPNMRIVLKRGMWHILTYNLKIYKSNIVQYVYDILSDIV